MKEIFALVDPFTVIQSIFKYNYGFYTRNSSKKLFNYQIDAELLKLKKNQIISLMNDHVLNDYNDLLLFLESFLFPRNHIAFTSGIQEFFKDHPVYLEKVKIVLETGNHNNDEASTYHL
jgi:hypothetical protein